jgi:tetratricopeptide (TPR) repeat protein
MMSNLVMKNPRKAFLCFTVLWLFLCSIITAADAQTVEEIAEKALAATVYLEMTDRNGESAGFGSGFFVAQDQVATNFHVIEGAAKGTAKQVGKYTKYTIEGISATDKENDLAILKVTAFGIEPLPLGDSETVKIGETVYVAGNPRGLEGTFSDGIISSLRERYTRKRLQMTAPISPGSSGGPVLNGKGKVIGVSFMILEGGQNLNFAIPSRYLKALLSRSKPARPFAPGKQPISAETYFSLGNMRYDLGLYKIAIEDYDRAIRLKPDFVDAYVNRGSSKAGLGKYIAAISDYDRAICLQPDLVQAYYNRGLAKDELGEHIAAIVDYNAAIRLKPDYADAYVNRGHAKAGLGEYIAAISDYDRAIWIEPDDAKTYNNRGVAKDELGEHIAAIVDYNAAIRLKPDYAVAYVNRGSSKAGLGKYIAAISDYDRAICLQPDLVQAYYNRGLAKDELGEHIAAIVDYNAAIRLKPDLVRAYYNRGKAKALLGHTWGAKQDLRNALQFANRFGDESLIAKIEEVFKLIE